MALLPQSLLLLRAQTSTQFVMGAAVSVLVMLVGMVVVVVVMMMRSGVVIFLIEGRIGWAKTFPLLLSLLQDTAVRQCTQPAEQLTIHLSPAFLFTIKSTLLFALLTGLGRSIFLLWVSTSLTLGPNKGCNNVTVLAWFWCSKLFDILRALLADSICFTFLLKLGSAVCAFDNWVCDTTLLAELLALRQLLKGVPLVTLSAGVQSRGSHPSLMSPWSNGIVVSSGRLNRLTKVYPLPALATWEQN